METSAYALARLREQIDNRNSFSVWANNTRIKKRLTCRKFAQQCGIRASRLADIENGREEATPIEMAAIWMVLAPENSKKVNTCRN